MTPEELGEVVADYAHRADLLERINTRFVPYAAQRIGRDLRSEEQEKKTTFDVQVNPFPLPADWSTPRLIQYLEDRGPRTLLSSTGHFTYRVDSRTGLGGAPVYYEIRSRAIEFSPFQSGDYTLSYYAKVALEANTNNELIDAFTPLWINAAMVELHTWTQDMALRKVALDMYTGEKDVINRNAEWARREAPAVQRA